MKGKLSVDNLYFEYPCWDGDEGVEVLSALNLEVSPGEVAVVVGGAESGKSTLALVLASLIPAHSGGRVSGDIHLDGIDVRNSRAADIIENVGIVFQDPEKQTVTTDCFSEAAFALESLGVAEEEIRRRLGEIFPMLGIAHLFSAGTAMTSGGEKKKLALAGLFAVDPDLWILDETLEEIDAPTRRMLMGFLRKSGRSVLIITSKYYDIYESADSFYRLSGGRLSERQSFPLSSDFISLLKKDGLLPDFSRIKEGSYDGGSGAGDGAVRPGKVLTAEGLRYSYQKGGEIPEDGEGFKLCVDAFSIDEGEVLSIVGRNGCGKSTLGKILCGIAEAEAGLISISDSEGEGLYGCEASRLNSFCAYMFQNPDYQIFLPTVGEELAWGLSEAGVPKKEAALRVAEAAEKFRLPSLDASPAMMSFSARKRLQAAIYYLLRRPVFILDEADTGLSFDDFISLLGEIKEASRAVLIITHSLELASAVSDRILGMSRGRITGEIEDRSAGGLEKWLAASESRESCGNGRTEDE